MNIGKIINQRRLMLGLTLEEVGNAVGVSKSTVKKWEDGFISNMKRDKIAELAKILKISPVALITGELEDEIEAVPSDTLTVLPGGKVFMRPLFDSVAAGFGAPADNTILSYIPTYINNGSEQDLYIWVNVQGDSMSPLIDDGIELLSVNPYYPPKRFEGAEVQRIRILGIVKEVSKTLQYEEKS